MACLAQAVPAGIAGIAGIAEIAVIAVIVEIAEIAMVSVADRLRSLHSRAQDEPVGVDWAYGVEMGCSW